MQQNIFHKDVFPKMQERQLHKGTESTGESVEQKTLSPIDSTDGGSEKSEAFT